MSSSPLSLTPLSPASISLLLELIVPPSLLTPLPPHLLSSALRQRHHFLHISADNPLEYLVWPSDVSLSHHNPIDLLETIQKPIEHHVYSVRYSADAESAFAHAAIDPPGLRLVFQWNQPDGWKYHNSALMPFPPSTFESLQDVMLYEFLDEPPLVVVRDEEDSYWDSYDQADDPSDQPSLRLAKAESHVNAEDAYWAQYSSVHGSGDSTLPTPPRVQMKTDVTERIVLAYPGLHPSSAYNPLAPPSPHTLARRLADISPRPESPPLVDLDDSDSASGSASPTPSPPSRFAALPPAAESVPLPPSVAATSPVIAADVPLPIEEAVEPKITEPCDPLLKDAIRSVFRLWQAGKQASSLTLAEDGETFLEIVRQVVAEFI